MIKQNQSQRKFAGMLLAYGLFALALAFGKIHGAEFVTGITTIFGLFTAGNVIDKMRGGQNENQIP